MGELLEKIASVLHKAFLGNKILIIFIIVSIVITGWIIHLLLNITDNKRVCNHTKGYYNHISELIVYHKCKKKITSISLDEPKDIIIEVNKDEYTEQNTNIIIITIQK